MQINYLDAISSVLNMMKQPDSACKNIDMHRTCYTTLFKYLMDKGIPFSMDQADCNHNCNGCHGCDQPTPAAPDVNIWEVIKRTE